MWPFNSKEYSPLDIKLVNQTDNTYGVNIEQGYQRGWGLQFGKLRENILQDPLYNEALEIARDNTILWELNRMNIFLILKFYLSQIPFGHIIEYGAYKGGNTMFMAYIAQKLYPGMKVYALDSFAGMPPTDKRLDAHNQGDFSDNSYEELLKNKEKFGLDNLIVVKGLFEETASAVLAEAKPIALNHIDCDIYSAVKYSYDVTKPFMVPGGYIVFDDAVTSSCIGATKAVEEYLIQRDHKFSEQIYPHFVFRA